MKKNGTTRWRCNNKSCGASTARSSQTASKNAAAFRLFYDWITAATSLVAIAAKAGVARLTLRQCFWWCWLIHPQPYIGSFPYLRLSLDRRHLLQ
ncbi:hypothetical protein [Corynebacterium epidermidicanis]|uniref:hypothetical protein n=1 Tax=Corynebacterium epidermidicanis TaxID=1050174 RepID=UPI0011877088|nr:hypothetical protein [Corynebacterium epidermidicanis]